MSEPHNCCFRKVRDFNGNILKLALKLEKEYENKNYDLYYVCKVVKDGNEEKKIKLYQETFTPEQVDNFYNNPSYYVTEIQDQEVI